MFLEKYLNEFYLEQVFKNYDEWYLNSLDEENFIKIYKLFRLYNFYFIDDIILNYLEIFEMEYDEVEESLNNLIDKLGNNFVYIIGNNMKYLNEIINHQKED